MLEVLTRGHPLLEAVAPTVKEHEFLAHDSFIDNLIVTAEERNGVGIAAPQVGQSLRLFIVASRPNIRYPQAPLMEPTAMINPRILAHSDNLVKDWEGCLSVPGWRALIPRYQFIEVEYRDRWGQLIHQELTDFVARIFQHELDHLNGILFPDRLIYADDLYTEEDYQKMIKTLT